MSSALGFLSRALPVAASDTVTLIVGDKAVQGWQRVMVTRPLQGIPASFDLEVTERYPTAPTIDIEPGQPCTVRIGSDLVITGYVDRYAASIGPGAHTIRVSGRSKSQDLVDCSAIFGDSSQPGFQAVNGNTRTIITQLAATYGVSVQSTAGDGVTIPQFNVNLGETPWEIIDRVSRYSQFLVYDLPDGSLMLAKVSTDQHASGFAVGANVESADVVLSMDQRFSEYEGHLTSILTFGTDAGLNAPGVGEVVKDEGVPRKRKRYVISEQFNEGVPIVKDRAIWERNVRWGRSFQFNCVADSWRDAGGRLWEPNRLAPVSADVLKLVNKSFLIGNVTYTRDETGQHATVQLMPPEAYAPEPMGSLGYVSTSDVANQNPVKPEPERAPGLTREQLVGPDPTPGGAEPEFKTVTV